MRKASIRRFAAIAVLVIAAVSFSSCSTAPRRRPANQQQSSDSSAQAAGSVPDAVSDAVETASASVAMAMARFGKTREALAEIAKAARESGNKALRASIKEARAWTLMFAGSKEEAREALRDAEATGELSDTARAVLEFRLSSPEQTAAARRSAKKAAAEGRIDARAADAIDVMSGDKDLRDVKFDSPAAAEAYATYLAGYRIHSSEGAYQTPAPAAGPSAGAAQAAPSAGSAQPAQTAAVPENAPVIVVRDCEAVNADAATMAVARLAYRDALVKRHRFRVVDADSRKGAVEELELKLSGAAAVEKDKAVGELFTADFVASGSVVKTDGGWLVAYTLSKSSDGRIVAGDFAAAADHAGIMGAAGRFAESLDAVVSN